MVSAPKPVSPTVSLICKSVWMKILFTFNLLRFPTLKKKELAAFVYSRIHLCDSRSVCVGALPIVNPRSSLTLEWKYCSGSVQAPPPSVRQGHDPSPASHPWALPDGFLKRTCVLTVRRIIFCQICYLHDHRAEYRSFYSTHKGEGPAQVHVEKEIVVNLSRCARYPLPSPDDTLSLLWLLLAFP